MNFDFTFSPSKSSRRRDEEPSRILVLGNLRGQETEAPAPLLERPIARTDIDNVDDLLARHAPSVVLGAEAGGERLQFRTFEDFHPDRLVETLSVFRRLLDVRRRLEHPGTFAGALAELRAPPIAGSPSHARSALPIPTTTRLRPRAAAWPEDLHLAGQHGIPGARLGRRADP